MTSIRLNTLSAMAIFSAFLSSQAQAQHPSADSYWGFSFDPASGVIHGYTVTEGSMSLSQCPPGGCSATPTHTYYATIALKGPNGGGTSDGTVYNTVRGFVYGSTRADDSIVVTNPQATYYISTTNKVVCTIAGAFFLYQLAQTPIPFCAYITNFSQVGPVQDIGNGALRFNYTWSSSSGKKTDLAACTIGEYVTYSGDGTVSFNNFLASTPPFPNNTDYADPTTSSNDPTASIVDTNFLTSYPANNFVKLYSIKTFTGTVPLELPMLSEWSVAVPGDEPAYSQDCYQFTSVRLVFFRKQAEHCASDWNRRGINIAIALKRSLL
jgi:hypothetical protein